MLNLTKNERLLLNGLLYAKATELYEKLDNEEDDIEIVEAEATLGMIENITRKLGGL